MGAYTEQAIKLLAGSADITADEVKAKMSQDKSVSDYIESLAKGLRVQAEGSTAE